MPRQDPDEEDYGSPEYGVRSSDLGSFIPEGTYRPIPIVWLAGAWVLQLVAIALLFMILAGRPGIYLILTTGLVSLYLGHMTFARGMAQQGAGWKVATIGVLGLNWGLVALAAYGMDG